MHSSISETTISQRHFVMAKSHLLINRHNSVALFRFPTRALNKICWRKRRGASIHCGQLNELLFIQHSLPTKYLHTSIQEIMILLIYTATFACFSISEKSIFARAVIGPPDVVTHSINITAVCSFSTLVYS